jgi:hypothetical protein
MGISSGIPLLWSFNSPRTLFPRTLPTEWRQPLVKWRILRSMVSSKSFLVPPILCVGLSLIVAAGCGDRHESFYPSLAYAIDAGEIDRGWIPNFLPESSRAIHIIYDPASQRHIVHLNSLPMTRNAS